MNSEDIRSAGQISCKIVTFLIFMVLDMALGGLSLFMDNSEKLLSESREEDNPNWDSALVLVLGTFVFPGVQFGLQLCLMFWYFSLIWKTFMFRFTVLDKLYETFRWLINFAILNFISFLLATVYRTVSIIGPDCKS